MMVRKDTLFILVLLGVAGFAFEAGAFEYPPAPATNYFNVADWRQIDRLVIPEAEPTEPEAVIRLREDTFIRLDEVVINGVLETQGHRLQIDAKRITFGPRGRIVAFLNAAQKGATGNPGRAGNPGGDYAGSGGAGQAPTAQAPRGADGPENPGEIILAAAEFVGRPVIDGVGQKGGQGGEGGRGGRGGTGGRGKPGEANCWGPASDGGRGGAGGRGGSGGKGGDGGNGGRAVSIVFVYGQVHEDYSPAHIYSWAGGAGLAGEAGLPGDPGDGGQGGSGETKGCLCAWDWCAYDSRAGGGAQGGQDRTDPGTAGPGAIGAVGAEANLELESVKAVEPFAERRQPGVNLVSTTALEDARLLLIPSWSSFHWQRTFYALLLDSVVQATTAGLNRPRAAELVSSGSLFEQLRDKVRRERAGVLATLWRDQFIQPLEARRQAGEVIYGLETALTNARRVADLFQKMSEGQNNDELKTSLEQVIDQSSEQVQSSLNTALDACRRFLQIRRTWGEVPSRFSSHYFVPACQRDPDFARPENLDKPIRLFSRSVGEVPAALQPFVARSVALRAPMKQKSTLRTIWDRVRPLIQWVIPEALASQFEPILVGGQTIDLNELRDSAVLRRSWIRPNRGALEGFTAPAEATVAELPFQLRLLSEQLAVRGGK